MLAAKGIETLAELSAFQAEQRGEATAFICQDQSVSYVQVDHFANQIANGLLAEGVHSQARIALLNKDSIAGYALLFGCAKAKAVLIGINWRLTSQEILYILNQGQAEVVFVGAEFMPVLEQIRGELASVRKIIVLGEVHTQWPSFSNWLEQFPPTAPQLTYSADDIVVQMYTSGTTGHPKGVQLPNYSFFRLMAGIRAQGDTWMGLTAEDVLLVALPQFHMGGLWWVVQGFMVGAVHVLMPVFIAWQALELIAKHHITQVEMVPAMLQTALDEPACETTDLASVRGFLYGGSPMVPTLLRRAMSVFQCGFYQIYGMTETGNMAVCLRPGDHFPIDSPRLMSAGRALPGVEILVIDATGQSLPARELGEVCLKSPANMLGYWQNEEANQNLFTQEGFIRTGDVGYLDEDGYLFICDRIKDMIICAGENIYPAEVEAVLHEHPAVADAAVIGIPDERWGETVKAIVVLRPGEVLKQRELINFTRGRIADYKMPKAVEFVDALPRNPSGKVLKRVLREPYWRVQERQVN